MTARCKRRPPLAKTDEELILEEWQANPGFWAEDVLGVRLWEHQIEALCSWRDNRDTSWRSCNGIGKTLADAVGVLWIGSCWEETSILTTATTFTQVKGSLWGEIANLVRNAKQPIGCEVLTTEIRWPHGSKAFAITAPPHDKDKAKMQGYRGRLQTFVLGDEASGLSPAILDGIDSMLTGSGSHKLLTGNPLDPTTEFKRTFERGNVNPIKTTAFDSPNFTAFGITLQDIINNTWKEKITGELPFRALTDPEWVANYFQKCGRNLRDPRFVARVLAEFPEASPDTLIPMHWIDAAIELGKRPPKPDESREPCHLGVDVARFGDDDSAITRRRGVRAKVKRVIHGFDTMEVTGAVIQEMKEEKATEARIDTTGASGVGVLDAGRKAGYPFFGINVACGAIDQEHFKNVRSESWFGVRDRFEATYRAFMHEHDYTGVPFQPGIILDPCEDQIMTRLVTELNAPRWRPDGTGHNVLEPKDHTKKRLGWSPDLADSLVNAFVVNVEAMEQKQDEQRMSAMGSW